MGWFLSSVGVVVLGSTVAMGAAVDILASTVFFRGAVVDSFVSSMCLSTLRIDSKSS